MRHITSVFFISILLVLFFSSFRTNSKTSSPDGINADVKGFVNSASLLAQSTIDYRLKNIDLDSLKQIHRYTRLHYKNIEFLAEYHFPSFVEEHINGAPLLHIERQGARPIVNLPEGLQVLDEMIFDEDVDVDQLVILAKKLENKANELAVGLQQIKTSEAQLIEAIRLQIIRCFTLGVTGFDTPGSLNALEEANASMISLAQNIQQVENSEEVHDLFIQAASYLTKNSDFNAFDRLTFLTKYVNPLFEQTLKLQLKKGGDVKVYSDPKGVNLNSNNLFSPTFLDPYFYTGLKKAEDTKELRVLGEQIFYDSTLSLNQNMSCATCHKPEKAFSDGLKKSATNVSNKVGQRNTPTLLNAVYADRYFYDLRAFELEQQAEHVIFNEDEFNTANTAIVAKLSSSKEYKTLFKKAFKSNEITQEKFSKALTSYVLSLQSWNSPIDKFIRHETSTIPDEVKKGFNLFMGKAACGTCHFAPTFSGLVPPLFKKNESEILGVLENPYVIHKILDTDFGRYANNIVSEKAWIYERSFKTTTVRNIEKTAPYFHNGAYLDLMSVINFYDMGGGAGQGLEVKNQTLSDAALALDLNEKNALISFLKALTDENY